MWPRHTLGNHRGQDTMMGQCRSTCRRMKSAEFYKIMAFHSIRWWIKNDRCGMIRMWGAYIWIFLIALHLYLNHLEVDKASSTGIFSTTYQSQIQSLSCNAITTQHTLNSSIKKVWFTVDIVSAVSLVESDTSSSFKLGHRSPEIHRISVEPPYHWWEDVQMTIKVQLEW